MFQKISVAIGKLLIAHANFGCVLLAEVKTWEIDGWWRKSLVLRETYSAPVRPPVRVGVNVNSE